MTWKDEIKKFKQGPPTKATADKYSSNEKYFEARKKEMENIAKLGEKLVFAFEAMSSSGGFEMSSKNKESLIRFKKALANLVEGVADETDVPSSDVYGKENLNPSEKESRAITSEQMRRIAEEIRESGKKLR